MDGGAEEDGGDEDVEMDSEVAPPDQEDDAGSDSGECEPKSCRELGYNCGMPEDGCTGALSCGSCKGYETCGGGGKNFVCGCTRATCESLSSERGVQVCGTIPDGCGGTLECGNSCAGSDTCGGGPAANQCGCTPNPDPCAGKQCGSASDGCGKTVQCGASAGACSANKECSGEQACVCKTDQAAFCAGKCGTQQTPDGCSVNCGGSCGMCDPGDGVACGSCQCPGTEICRAGACCVPEDTATLCAAAVCGTRVNRCGQTVTCGTCGAGTACTSEGKCESPAAAALIGKYAVRSVGFGAALSVVTRAEGLLLVDIYRDSSGKLVMHEQPCWSGAYTKASGSCPAGMNCEDAVTEITPAISARAVPSTIELDLSNTASWNGTKDWVRPVQPLSQNAAGWRRGRPSYCPAAGGPPDSAHPDFAPANDTRAIGARKPWLPANTVCKCPSEEFATANRAPCKGLTGAKLTECMADPATYSIPYSSGSTAAASTVTDCRVVDDDLDGIPGNTAVVKAKVGVTLQATIGSASVFANVFWGTADTTSAKRHWGVSQDQPGLQTSNVYCDGNFLLCGTSSGDLCPGYRGQPYNQANRMNPVDFVPLSDKTPPAGGWANPGQPVEASCAEIAAHHYDTAWFSNVIWSTRYPNASECTL